MAAPTSTAKLINALANGGPSTQGGEWTLAGSEAISALSSDVASYHPVGDDAGMKDKRSVTVDIAFTHSGWGEIALAVGDQSVVVGPISYGTNALADFARFGLAACVGEPRFACRFDGEPIESRLIGEREWEMEPECLSLRLLHFKDIYANAPDAKGEVWFHQRCDGDLLARAILDAIGRLGPDGYRGWSHPFPYRILAALEAALAEPAA